MFILYFVQKIIIHLGAYSITGLQFEIPTTGQKILKIHWNGLTGITVVLPHFDDILVVASSEQLEQKLGAIFQKLVSFFHIVMKDKTTVAETFLQLL